MEIVTLNQYKDEYKQKTGSQENDFEFDKTVLGIIETVRENGDEALLDFTEKFDGIRLDNLIVSADEFEEARTLITDDFLVALKKAKNRITAFHEEQKEKSWFINPEQGIMLGQKVTRTSIVSVFTYREGKRLTHRQF